MSKNRQKRRRKKKISPPPKKLDPQQRTSEFITVGWMLTTLATLAAEVLALLVTIFLHWSTADWSAEIRGLPNLMLVIACLSGMIGLVLCAVATKIREVPAPRAVTQGSIFICLLPWLTISARWVAG
jgi:ABC-type polysaccharide/polyol phosphate export permease